MVKRFPVGFDLKPSESANLDVVLRLLVADLPPPSPSFSVFGRVADEEGQRGIAAHRTPAAARAVGEQDRPLSRRNSHSTGYGVKVIDLNRTAKERLPRCQGFRDARPGLPRRVGHRDELEIRGRRERVVAVPGSVGSGPAWHHTEPVRAPQPCSAGL